MKKQIFILLLFVMATFVNVNKSYGQAACTPDALHPAAGISYDYTTIVGAPYAGTGTYEWFVTTDPNIHARTAPVAGLYTFNSGQGTATINVTWSAAAVALARTTPIYLALWYSEPNPTDNTCTIENVRAIQIAPVNTFLLAIEPTNATGTTVTPTVCAPDVLTAVVDNPADVVAGEDNLDASMTITYGENTLYYRITASGVNSDWRPEVTIPALINSQTYTSVDWSADGGTNWTAIAGGTASTGGTYTLTDVAASVAGTSYLVRLVVNQHTNESLTAQGLTVAIDGTLAPDHTINDIVSITDCDDETTDKNATGTILPRPTITPGTPAFMIKAPAN